MKAAAIAHIATTVVSVVITVTVTKGMEAATQRAAMARRKTVYSASKIFGMMSGNRQTLCNAWLANLWCYTI